MTAAAITVGVTALWSSAPALDTSSSSNGTAEVVLGLTTTAVATSDAAPAPKTVSHA